MTSTRREFLHTAAAAPLVSPILLGLQDKAGSKKPVMGTRRLHLRGRPRLGPAAGGPGVGQHARRGPGRAGAHVRAPHRPRDQRAAGHGRGLRPEGQLRPLVGQGVPRRRARPAHPHGRQGRVPLPHRERRQPEDDAATREAGGGRQDDAEGRGRLEHRRPAGRRRLQAGRGRDGGEVQPDQRRHRAERRRLRRRRLRLVLHQPVQRQGRAHPDLRRPRLRAGQADRAARHLDGHARRRHRSSSSPIAATTGCSASRWTDSTSTSSPASGCRATSTSTRAWSSCPTCTAA